MLNPGRIAVFFSTALSFYGCGTGPGSHHPKQLTDLYNEPHRPQYHFTPDSMWMNDPNGLVYYQGEYHLFYQKNPYANIWGPMHWGHAVSTDLVHWEHLPIALYPDSIGTIFSGSAVVDWNNTTGLGDGNIPPIVAVFTYHNQEQSDAGSNTFQNQGIAYSLDRGRSWAKFKGNPVLENPGIRDFRDPKVFWYEPGKKWIMVLAAFDRIIFYASPDLVKWNKESEFWDEVHPASGVWECPDLFPLGTGEDEKWVLTISSSAGAPNGGSGTLYYIGSFNGHIFREQNLPPGPRWMDYGKDNYAGVTWSDIPREDGRRIFIGWMSNWQYANQVPTERWRSALTLPRALSLSNKSGDISLISNPVKELQKIRNSTFVFEQASLGDTISLDEIAGLLPGQFELELEFHWPKDPSRGDPGNLGLILWNDLHQNVVIGYDSDSSRIYVDRTHSGISGFSEHFPGSHSAPFQPENNQIRFHLFIDRSSIELFIDDGRLVMTELIFPEQDLRHLRIFATDKTVMLKNSSLHCLQTTW